MSKQSIEVTPKAFHVIMIGLQKAMLLMGADIPEVADVLVIRMFAEPLRPYLQVRVTCVEVFDQGDDAWQFSYCGTEPDRVALVSFNLGLSID